MSPFEEKKPKEDGGLPASALFLSNLAVPEQETQANSLRLIAMGGEFQGNADDLPGLTSRQGIGGRSGRKREINEEYADGGRSGEVRGALPEEREEEDDATRRAVLSRRSPCRRRAGLLSLPGGAA